jgi:hypothetical protein
MTTSAAANPYRARNLNFGVESFEIARVINAIGYVFVFVLTGES